jgi:hypothetical protein
VILNGTSVLNSCENTGHSGHMFVWTHRRNTFIRNSTDTGGINAIIPVQHKVFISGDSFLRGSVAKLKSELGAKFKVFCVIRPEAGTAKSVTYIIYIRATFCSQCGC